MEPVHVKVRKQFPTKNTLEQYKQPGVLIGARYYTADDPPFELDPRKAKELVDLGLVDIVVKPAIETAQRAVQPKLEASRR